MVLDVFLSLMCSLTTNLVMYVSIMYIDMNLKTVCYTLWWARGSFEVFDVFISYRHQFFCAMIV